ncbi:6-bladed beta-propeller [Paraprevotella clara]
MKKVFYFFAVLLLLSCHHASQKGHMVSVRIDPDEAENSIAAGEWQDTAGCALIPLADTEKPITNATRLKTHGDKIYIQDEETHCLHVFHADGTLDFSIDRRGKAGNEYLWLSDFHATDERLYLLDHIGQKILECDTLGRFIRKRDIDGYYANGIFATNKALFLVNEGSTPLVHIDFRRHALPEEYHHLNLLEIMRRGLFRQYVTGINRIFGNGKLVFLQYHYGDDWNWIVYDREQQEVVKHGQTLDVNHTYRIGLNEFAMEDGYVYEICPAFDFLMHVEHFMPRISPEPRYRKELEETAARLTDASNPVLVRYKFKHAE